MRRALPIRLALALSLAAPAFVALPRTAAAEDAPKVLLGRVNEILLPSYQTSALTRDLPAADLLMDKDGRSLFVLGKAALWQWNLAARSLKRLVLRDEDTAHDPGPLSHLGSDGIHLFVAARTALFQIQWPNIHVYRYDNHPATTGRPLGFAGNGDNFWLVSSHAALKFDRYGHTLSARLELPALGPTDHAVLDKAGKHLWFIRKTALYRVDTDGNGKAPVVLFRAKHRLLDLALVGGELITHTAHAVLRMHPDGQLIGSIPVEEHRRLLAMSVTPEAHAYLFSDQLLEVFLIKEHTVRRFRLPLEDGEKPSHLALQGHLLTLLAAGRPRVFLLEL